VVANPGLAGGGVGPSGQNSDGGGFPGTVWAEQAEDFSGKNFEGKSIESGDLRLLRLTSFGIATRNEAASSARRRSGVIDLAQVLGANTNGHFEETPIVQRMEPRALF
jgi:hypothetical protein